MVIRIIGESCTGKSILADKLKSLLGVEVYTRKDYLPLLPDMIFRVLFTADLDVIK